jgi:hypothetical protein
LTRYRQKFAKIREDFMGITHRLPLVLLLSPSILSSFRRTHVVLLLTVFSVHFLSAGEDTPRTLQSFGVQVNHGQPVYPLPPNVALGLFNTDPLLDVAYCTGRKVQVYQNLGNGHFDLVGERSILGEVAKMEWRKERMSSPTLFNQFSWGELQITYRDARREVFSRESFGPQQGNLAPWALSTPALDFRERWRSQPHTQPSTKMGMEDIDSDGRFEVAYYFPPDLGDSNRIVVYECVGDDSFAVDWDTVITLGAGPFAITDIDNDGHKEIVITRSGATGQVAMLECLAPGRYRYYETNIGYPFPPFKAIETNIDFNARKELVLLTSNPSPPSGQDPTLIYVADYVGKGPGPNGWVMAFNQQIARYGGYTFDMAIGQVDGTGREEIILGGGGFGATDPVPVGYLWYNGSTWVDRSIYTGLRSGSAVPMFVNLDADSTMELFIGGIGPIGHGSCYALDYLSDTTWRVLWADSSLRGSPFFLDAGILGGQFVVTGFNTWERITLDTLYSQLHVYLPSGAKLGTWHRDSVSVQNYRIIDIDNDGKANIIGAILMRRNHHLADYEYFGVSDVVEGPTMGSTGFQLGQGYPNPFNPATTIGFYVAQRSDVRIAIHDILGREVKTIIEKDMLQGAYTVIWNGTTNEGGDVASGVYFCRMIVTGGKETLYTKTQKMLLIR